MSVCTTVYLSVCTTVCLETCLSIRAFNCLDNCLGTPSLDVCLSICLDNCPLCVHLTNSLSVWTPLCISLSLYTCLSVSPDPCLSVFICLDSCLLRVYTTVCLSVSLDICLSIGVFFCLDLLFVWLSVWSPFLLHVWTRLSVCMCASLDTCLSVWIHAVSISHHVFPSLPVIQNVLNRNDKMASSSLSASICVSILAVTEKLLQ